MPEPHYEVELHRSRLGLFWGVVYHCTEDGRETIGDTRSSSLGGFAFDRAMALGMARRIARSHRDGPAGPETVRLDLDSG